MAINTTLNYYTYKYPSEQLVTHLSVVAKNFENIRDIKALDFGFGAGRHIKLLTEFGFNTYGLDVKQEAIDTMKFHYGELVPKKNIVIDNIFENPNIFDERCFDLIVSFGVTYIWDFEHTQEVIRTISKWLKPGGYFLSNFRTKYDDQYINAKKLVNVYSPDNPYFTFLNYNDMDSLMKTNEMSIINCERYDRFTKNMTERLSYWMCTAQKNK